MKYLSGNGMAASADLKRQAHAVRTHFEINGRDTRRSNRQAIANALERRKAVESDPVAKAEIYVPARVEIPRLDPRRRHAMFTERRR